VRLWPCARLARIAVISVIVGACAGSPTRGEVVSSATQAVTPTRATTAAPNTPVPAGQPLGRGYHLLLDLGDRGVWMFGGETAGPRLGGRELMDTWTYQRSSGWSERGRGSAPTATGDAIAYDAASGRVVVLAFEGPSYESVSETWVYDVSADRWERRALGAGPLAVHGARAAYAAKADRLIVLDEFGETSAYDVDTDTWTKRAPASHPPGRRYYAMAYDEAADRVILFGGLGSGDTWAYDFASNAWKDMAPPTSPSARLYHAMAYDKKTARVILFGGAGTGEQPLGDTWSYDYRANTWTELRPQTAPSARAWHSMAYDAVGGSIVLFGGGTDRAHFGADTWIYDPARNAWSPAP